MADEDDSQKTEDPTARKLSKAKEKGQTGSSQEVKNWASLLGAGFGVALLAPWLMERLTVLNAELFERVEAIHLTRATLPLLMGDILLEVGIVLSPVFGVLVILAVVSNVAQTGFLMAPSKLAPTLNKISLVSGVKRMFGLRSVVEFLKGLFKLTVLAFVAFSMAMPWMTDIALLPDFELEAILDRIYIVVLSILAGSLMVMFTVAVLDFAYQKFEFIKSQKMSRQEIKDEHKDTEGDPQVKARIRKIRAQRAQQRMMSSVPDADVVVTNPTHFAVALQYKMDNMQAPKLVAKGVDSLALKIREVADEHNVPIVENPPLARALYAAVELDEEIPVEHYQAVAEIIGYVMGLKGKKSGGNEQTIHRR